MAKFTSIVFDKDACYHVKELGVGTFGTVIKCFDKNANKYFATKVSNGASKSQSVIIDREVDILRSLQDIPNVPKLLDYTATNLASSCFSMTCLGLTLHEYVARFGGQLDAADVCRVAVSLLKTLCEIHRRGIVHRDIKPSNFVFDMSLENLYIVDFGMATSVVNELEGDVSKKTFIGTAQYTSLNGHLRRAQSYLDDLESLGYVLHKLYTGSLPWMHKTDIEDPVIRNHIIFEDKKRYYATMNRALDVEFPALGRYFALVRDNQERLHAMLQSCREDEFCTAADEMSMMYPAETADIVEPVKFGCNCMNSRLIHSSLIDLFVQDFDMMGETDLSFSI